MYQVKINIYNSPAKIVVTGLSWENALQLYNGFQIPADWTRASSCESEINHMDMRSNLFNEGSIMLTRNDYFN